jgi:hypothetical protein
LFHLEKTSRFLDNSLNMETILAQLETLGIAIPEISLPSPHIDLQKWAVIACDQYTQDRDYWKNLDERIGDAPSTLRLIFPEVYLGDDDAGSRAAAIHQTMSAYLQGEYTAHQILSPGRRAGVFIERENERGVRRGFLLAVDLERYDWRRGGQSLIRATEETIEERLPPRVKIRENAPLECPHILLLIDDPENMLMGIFDKLMKDAPLAYSGTLNNGDMVRGRSVYRKTDWAFINDALQHLYRRSITNSGSEKAVLFAVGDGNHSLAAAKETWERYKAAHRGESGLETHRARYAMVEIVNLYDPNLRFEPIHRAFFNLSHNELLAAARARGIFEEREAAGFDALLRAAGEKDGAKNRFGIFSQNKWTLLESPGGRAAALDMEPLLQDLLREGQAEPPPRSLDYIHGEKELRRIVDSSSGVCGVLMPPFQKEGLFKTIAENGPLPRKSFSIGGAEDKRFYLECRKLFC